MAWDWDKFAEKLGIVGATLRDMGAAYDGRTGDSLTQLYALKKYEKEKAERQSKYNSAVSGAVGKFYRPTKPMGPGEIDPAGIDPRGYTGGVLSGLGPQIAPLLANMEPDQGSAVLASILTEAAKARDPVSFNPEHGLYDPMSRDFLVRPEPKDQFNTVAEGSTLTRNGQPIYTTPQSPVAGRDTPYPAAVHDQRLAERAAGRTNMNVTVGQERAFAQERGKGQGERLNKMIAAADVSRGKIDMLMALQPSLADAPFAGPLADTFTDASKLLQQLGISETDTSSAEVARSLSNQLTMMLRNPSGGAGMPGAMSDADRLFLSASVPGLRNTRGGATAMINIMLQIERRNMQVAELAEMYSESYGSLTGFDKYLRQWVEMNPLFDQSAMPQGGGSEWIEVAPGIRRRR